MTPRDSSEKYKNSLKAFVSVGPGITTNEIAINKWVFRVPKGLDYLVYYSVKAALVIGRLK